MKFTNSLIKGKLIKRYKRFFIDVKLNKEIVTAHCPNTGSMKGLLDKGNDVFLLKHDDPKRKLKYGLEMIITNDFIKIILFLILVLDHVKCEDLLEISLSKDYNKYEPPLKTNENDQDFDPLEVQLKFKSFMIIEIKQEHQTIIAYIEIDSYWVEHRLVVTGNTSDSTSTSLKVFHFYSLVVVVSQELSRQCLSSLKSL